MQPWLTNKTPQWAQTQPAGRQAETKNGGGAQTNRRPRPPPKRKPPTVFPEAEPVTEPKNTERVSSHRPRRNAPYDPGSPIVARESEQVIINGLTFPRWPAPVPARFRPPSRPGKNPPPPDPERRPNGTQRQTRELGNVGSLPLKKGSGIASAEAQVHGPSNESGNVGNVLAKGESARVPKNPSSSSVQSQVSVNCSPPGASPAAASVMSPHPSTPLPTPRQAVLPSTFSPAQQNPLAVTNPLTGPASVKPVVSLGNNKNPHVTTSAVTPMNGAAPKNSSPSDTQPQPSLSCSPPAAPPTVALPSISPTPLPAGSPSSRPSVPLGALPPAQRMVSPPNPVAATSPPTVPAPVHPVRSPGNNNNGSQYVPCIPSSQTTSEMAPMNGAAPMRPRSQLGNLVNASTRGSMMLQHPDSRTDNPNTSNLNRANYTPPVNSGSQYPGESGGVPSQHIPNAPPTPQSLPNERRRVDNDLVTANPETPFQGVPPQNPGLVRQPLQPYPLSASPSQQHPTQDANTPPHPYPLGPGNVGPSPYQSPIPSPSPGVSAQNSPSTPVIPQNIRPTNVRSLELMQSLAKWARGEEFADKEFDLVLSHLISQKPKKPS